MTDLTANIDSMLCQLEEFNWLAGDQPLHMLGPIVADLAQLHSNLAYVPAEQRERVERM